MAATGVAALLALVLCHTTSATQNTDSLCADTRERYLSATGPDSTLVLPLLPVQTIQGIDQNQNGPCRARITAPDSHAIGLRLVGAQTVQNDNFAQNKPGGANKQSRNHHGSHQKGNANGTLLGCPLSVYLPDDRQSPVWRFDPCLGGAQPGASRLLPGRVNIAWSPPEDGSPVPLALVATAVGRGEGLCREKDRHVCVHIGRAPLLCISDHLLCDGVRHCPLGDMEGEGDEDPRLCSERTEKPRQNTWDVIAMAILKRLASSRPAPLDHTPPPTGKDPPASTESVPPAENPMFSTLSQYGPWGFLLIGVLLCGSMLLFCGLWECYCRRPKPSTPLVDPCASLSTPGPSASHSAQTVSPPMYDDLDRPPAYNILFPSGLKNPEDESTDEGLQSDV